MKYWVWLTTIPYIGPISANKLLKKFENPENIYCADKTEFERIDGITYKQIESILMNKTLENAEKILEKCDKQHISILIQKDSRYPTRIKELVDVPVVLYYRGNIPIMHKTVGIVGSRRCTQEAKEQVVNLTEKCVEEGKTIISGMAKGIDAYAHTACLKFGGSTVAILGNGLDICYPSEHNRLMEYIIQKGLVISEYPPGTIPAKYHFPRRNRLISACSDQLYVIAPGKGSGALITAEYANEYGKNVNIIVSG